MLENGSQSAAAAILLQPLIGVFCVQCFLTAVEATVPEYNGWRNLLTEGKKKLPIYGQFKSVMGKAWLYGDHRQYSASC